MIRDASLTEWFRALGEPTDEDVVAICKSLISALIDDSLELTRVAALMSHMPLTVSVDGIRRASSDLDDIAFELSEVVRALTHD